MITKIKIIGICSVSFLFLTLCLAGDEPNNWFDDAWLSEPKIGESRPAWWYDVWGQGGLIIIASIDKEHNDQAKYDWREISIISPSEKKDAIIIEKTKLTSQHLKIHQIVSISKALKLEHLGIQEAGVIKVFMTEKFNERFGIYRNDHKFSIGEKYVFFIKRGGNKSEELHIDYIMPLDKLDGITKIVKAAESSQK